jgi:hypothetical protein
MADAFIGGKGVFTAGQQMAACYNWDGVNFQWIPALASTGGPTSNVTVINSLLSTSDSHTTAALPLAVRLSDGTNFYTATGGGGGGSNAAAGLTAAAVPTSASYTGFNSGGNLVGISTSNPMPVAQQGSLAVTGTFYQGTQPVSIAGTVPVSIAATVPVSIASMPTTPVTMTSTTITGSVAVTAASLPLPTGAASLAKQPALGTAGTASTDVITVQGIASMTALKVDGSGVVQPVSMTSTTITGSVAVTVASTLPVSLTSTTITGSVAVTVASTLPVSISSMPSTPVTGTFWPVTQPISVAATLPVSIAATLPVTLASTTITGSVAVVGPTAAASTLTTAPQTTGGLGVTANPTKVTTGQVVNRMHDVVGRTVVVQGAPRELVSNASATITTTAATTIIPLATGFFNDVTDITVANSSATATLATLTGGAASVLIWLPASGYFARAYNPPLPAATVSTNWVLTLGTAVTSVYVNVNFIKNL